MRTATVVSEFLRIQYDAKRLVQSGIVEATGLARATISLVIKGERPFPMYYIDEVAAFFGYDTPDFIIYARGEVRRAGRWDSGSVPGDEEAQRLRALRLRAGIFTE